MIFMRTSIVLFAASFPTFVYNFRSRHHQLPLLQQLLARLVLLLFFVFQSPQFYQFIIRREQLWLTACVLIYPLYYVDLLRYLIRIQGIKRRFMGLKLCHILIIHYSTLFNALKHNNSAPSVSYWKHLPLLVERYCWQQILLRNVRGVRLTQHIKV